MFYEYKNQRVTIFKFSQVSTWRAQALDFLSSTVSTHWAVRTKYVPFSGIFLPFTLQIYNTFQRRWTIPNHFNQSQIPSVHHWLTSISLISAFPTLGSLNSIRLRKASHIKYLTFELQVQLPNTSRSISMGEQPGSHFAQTKVTSFDSQLRWQNYKREIEIAQTMVTFLTLRPEWERNLSFSSSNHILSQNLVHKIFK